ncbi:Trk system potassium uptake protein TrkH [Pelagimonas phthalicica]|uniref:Trk system potassium uptake protein n=1 Tax=Pelagimonas phthalicica TaxID=1037362 RepID=A0A238JB21_9RHOB|nr:TrkH family potassium uptake protein [Pelagimonas phthalicica]TDS93589.1 trk system potassium uptake protein TrkH [Pelagimonas phthalicica]SMX27890.1 Trk system potassium uptake protein TrkH [Pelagimonas phthalicica]
MFDIRPVAYVIGLLVTILGATMFLPMLVDIAEGRGHWPVFLESALITIMSGGLTALACSNAVKKGLSIQQTFLLTTGVWLALPVFGALPFMIGETHSSYTDAFFEAMSGLTTTGSTVLSGLDDLPKGLLLWRGLLQWIGGIGIIVVAMVFLPELRVGGMQIFRSEGFDTMGKILPRATQISSSISTIYVSLTLICAGGYLLSGMDPFDATVHAMTTVATGGFANYDASFGAFSASAEYVCVVFMMLAALPFVRFVQMTALRDVRPLFQDSQVRGFFVTAIVIVALVAFWRYSIGDANGEEAYRKVLFNVVSILTGTGYASQDYGLWGGFAVALFFFVGLIGGCAGSTACSVKIFRYQLLFASISTQLRRIRSPSGVFTTRYAGVPVGAEVMSSVMSFFVFFVVSLGVLSVALSLTGLDFITSVSGAATALANVGPGLGDQIGPAGNFADIGDPAKWMLSFAMLAGRLELLAVYAIFTIRFWRA